MSKQNLSWLVYPLSLTSLDVLNDETQEAVTILARGDSGVVSTAVFDVLVDPPGPLSILIQCEEVDYTKEVTVGGTVDDV